jgi:capsular polysaccharide biosynthesis protein
METKMEEIDLKELFHILLRRWWVLAVCSIVLSAAVGFWGYYNTIPVYEANTTLYIGKNIEQSGQFSANDLYMGTMLIQDYQEIAKSRLVASSVISELGLKNMSTDQMAAKINVTPKNETRVIQISVIDTSPKMAMDITNKAAEVFQKKVIDIMQIENAQIIDKAELPRFPIPSNNSRNVAVAFVLGLAIGTGIIFLINFLDNTIKTPDDVKKYVDLPVIGTIPVFPK